MKRDKDFIRLQKEWYSKLKEDGFEDIEYFDRNMEPKDMMHREQTKFSNNVDKDKFESTEQYYIEARQFYWDYDFQDDTSKQIWLEHSDGLSYRNIAKKLNQPYQRVFSTINKLRKVMGR